jgi:hypothetical protein
MGGSTAAHMHMPMHTATPTAAPSWWSVPSPSVSARRRIGLVLAVVGAVIGTAVVLSVTSTVVARLG